MKLPRFLALKSNQNKKYLRYKHEKGEGRGFLDFSGEEVLSPYTKFQVVEAEHSHWDGLVHIKCCINNKFWVRHSDKDHWIVGEANDPEEDKSKWSCTLFKPILLGANGDARKVLFSHVQLGHLACSSNASTSYGSSLLQILRDPQNNSLDVCTIVDLDSLAVLPKLVLFKGPNGLYLSPTRRAYADSGHMDFESGDKLSQNAWHEVVTHSDGSIQIKSRGYGGKYWSKVEKWVTGVFANRYADKDPSSFFIPVKVHSNVIAIKRVATNTFCRGISGPMHSNSLVADVSTITSETKIVVEEPVVSREIFDVRYDLMNAKINNNHIQDTIEQTVSNDTGETTTVNLLFSYDETNRKVWSSYISMRSDYKFTFSASIPVVMKAKAELIGNFHGEMKWGQAFVSKTKKQARYNVVVPPHSKRKACLVVRMGSCNVPFSYVQCDTLYDGQKVTSTKNDGIYSGANFTILDFNVIKFV